MLLPSLSLALIFLFWCTDWFSISFGSSTWAHKSFTLLFNCSVLSDPLRPHGLWPARLHCPWYFLGKNTEMDSHSILQRIFLTQGSNPGLLHCKQTLYHLSHQGRREFIHMLKKFFKNVSMLPFCTPPGI